MFLFPLASGSAESGLRLVGGLAYQRISVAFRGFINTALLRSIKTPRLQCMFFLDFLQVPYLEYLFINLFTRILISEKNRPTVVPT